MPAGSVLGALIGWEVEYRSSKSTRNLAARAAELRERVSGKPDHPERHDLATLDAELKHGAYVVSSRAMIFASDRWRIGDSHPLYADLLFIDDAVDRKKGWRMQPRQILIADEERRGGPRPETSAHSFSRLVSIWAGGGIDPDAVMTCVPVPQTPGGFTVEFKPNDGVTGIAKGIWDEVSRTLVISEVVIKSGPSDVEHRELSGFRVIPGLSRSLYTIARCTWDGSPVIVESRFVGVQHPTISADRALATPGFRAIDAIRGVVTAASIADYSGGHAAIIERDAPAHSPSPGVSRATPASENNSGRWIVLVTFAAVVAALIWVLNARRSAAKRSPS